MPKDFERSRRVAEVIQRELAGIIQRERVDSRLSMVTIAMIDLSPDLRNARVYFTTMCEDLSFKEQAKILNEAKKQLRFELSRSLSLRGVPVLNFVYDETQVRATHLSNLIDNVISEDEKNNKDS